MPTPITVAHGDGIGPEIMAATLKILEAAKADLAIETINIGEQVYLSGIMSGIEANAWNSLRSTKVFLKAPITTPQGGGVKSLNVTVRKTLGLYANVRPCVAYSPFVETRHPDMDVVIVRENEEDLYGGIEHQQTQDVVQCLKLISRPGSERIVRYAFEYAKQNNRKKVTCFTKDNIMKLTDGLFHKVFNEIAAEYPQIESEHWIIDIGTAKLADRPEQFDVIVVPNLYGDIISDVAAEITGSVGLGGSANIGDHCAMFEAIHGSAPDIAGQNIANPSGLLLGAVMMLVHINQTEVATKIHNAWLKTLEDGIHTGDIYNPEHSKQKVGTQEFAEAVIERLGSVPSQFTPKAYQAAEESLQHVLDKHVNSKPAAKPAQRDLVGVDVFVCWGGGKPEELASILTPIPSHKLELTSIGNRGTKVWPEGHPETFCSDHWRCRFVSEAGIQHQDILNLLSEFNQAGVEFVKIENLYNFDGEPGFTRVQGE